jgi:hypothetical protein
MPKKALLIFIGILFTAATAMASDSTRIQIIPTFLGQKLVLDSTYSVAGNALSIETFKCYLSQVCLIKNGQPVWKEANSYHLLDASESRTLAWTLMLPDQLEYDALQFNLGIDSLTNVSGAMGGDLDPTNGMYWTWQSGYINFKLEGYSPQCTSRNHAFQFHLGGYLPPFQCVQTIQLSDITPQNTLPIGMDLGVFLKEIDLVKQHTLMSPGPAAQALSQKAGRIFYWHE